MITYEKFKEIIVRYIIFSKCESTLRESNIEIFESPLFETTGYYLDWLLEAYFTESGVDTINWWMFEYHTLEEDFDKNGNYIGDPNKEPGMWDKDDNIIPMITIEDLWNEVKDLRKKSEEEVSNIVKLKELSNQVDVKALESVTEDFWDKILTYFDNIDNLVCVDDVSVENLINEIIANIKPTEEKDLEDCYIKIYKDTELGSLLILSIDDDYKVYIWQE